MNNEFKDKTKELIELYKSLNNIDYKTSKKDKLIEIHQYNLNIQKDTYNTIKTYLNNFLTYINNLNNLDDYYDELRILSITKNKVPTLEELNITNYISLISINENNILTQEINNFYRKINEIIINIQNKRNEIDKIKTEIEETKNKIENLEKERKIKLKIISKEKNKITNEINELEEEIKKTFILNIFKKDYIYSKIDILKQEYDSYNQKEIELNKDYDKKIKIEKEKVKTLINKLD